MYLHILFVFSAVGSHSPCSERFAPLAHDANCKCGENICTHGHSTCIDGKCDFTYVKESNYNARNNGQDKPIIWYHNDVWK